MDLAFQKLLEAQEETYAATEAFGNGWMPPDAEYTVTIIKQRSGVSTKGNEAIGWWAHKGRIEDVESEFYGREFNCGRFGTSCHGALKAAAAVLNGGLELIKTTTNPKGTFTNCHYLQVLEAMDEEDVVEAPEEEAVDVADAEEVVEEVAEENVVEEVAEENVVEEVAEENVVEEANVVTDVPEGGDNTAPENDAQ
jgi:hypothetical protein